MAIGDRYSRFVQFAKIVFPLVALGLLSTLFLFSRSIDPDDAIPFAEVDVEQIARDQKLASPRFSGVSTDGSAISVIAESAQPDANNPRLLSAQIVTANIETPRGTVFDVDANEAKYDGDRDRLELKGSVEITSSTGFLLRTNRLMAFMQELELASPEEVYGSAPFGEISSGRMRLVERENGYLLIFQDGVKLIYEPGS